MKKIGASIIAVILTFATVASAQQRGDTVYTCHYHRTGFMWTSGSYEGCRAVVLERLGSQYRIEYTGGFCVDYNEGHRRVVSSGEIFLPYQVKTGSWGPNICDKKYINNARN